MEHALLYYVYFEDHHDYDCGTLYSFAIAFKTVEFSSEFFFCKLQGTLYMNPYMNLFEWMLRDDDFTDRRFKMIKLILLFNSL